MPTKISVLMPNDEALRFESFCNARGHKKSTLIVRLIKEHLDKEKFASVDASSNKVSISVINPIPALKELTEQETKQ